MKTLDKEELKAKIKKNLSLLIDGGYGILNFAIAGWFISNQDIDFAFISASTGGLLIGIFGLSKKRKLASQFISSNYLFFFLLFLGFKFLHFLPVPLGAMAGVLIGFEIQKKTAHLLSKLTLIIASSALFSFIGLYLVSDLSIRLYGVSKNIELQEFELIDYEKQRHSLASFNQNKVVIISFWASWCHPCMKELPIMNDIYKEYEDNDNVSFIFVNTGWNESFKEFQRFVDNSEFNLPFYYDYDSVATKQFDVRSIPTLAFVDKKGELRYQYSSLLSAKTLQKLINEKIEFLSNE